MSFSLAEVYGVKNDWKDINIFFFNTEFHRVFTVFHGLSGFELCDNSV